MPPVGSCERESERRLGVGAGRPTRARSSGPKGGGPAPTQAHLPRAAHAASSLCSPPQLPGPERPPLPPSTAATTASITHLPARSAPSCVSGCALQAPSHLRPPSPCNPLFALHRTTRGAPPWAGQHPTSVLCTYNCSLLPVLIPLRCMQVPAGAPGLLLRGPGQRAGPAGAQPHLHAQGVLPQADSKVGRRAEPRGGGLGGSIFTAGRGGWAGPQRRSCASSRGGPAAAEPGWAPLAGRRERAAR